MKTVTLVPREIMHWMVAVAKRPAGPSVRKSPCTPSTKEDFPLRGPQPPSPSSACRVYHKWFDLGSPKAINHHFRPDFPTPFLASERAARALRGAGLEAVLEAAADGAQVPHPSSAGNLSALSLL
jgi:hypothetical protein